MKSFPIPASPLTHWDKAIMKEFPFRYQLNRTGIFDDAVDFVRDNFYHKSCTWKGPTFFFKNEKDFLLFVLRWS